MTEQPGGKGQPGFGGKLLPLLLLTGGLALALAQWFIFVHAPEERLMGLTQKIFYLHLPLAWWALISFLLAAVAGAFYLARRGPRWDALNEAALECGLLLALLALASGSVWARTAWNTWWIWDPRLTTTLIMCFIYAAVLLLRRLPARPERGARLAAVLSLVAFADVPLVFFSARLWPRSIHPAVVGQSGGLAAEMITTLVICLAAFGLVWLGLLLLRCRLGLCERRLADLLVSDGGEHE